MKRHNIPMDNAQGCKGCNKDCNWRALSVAKDSSNYSVSEIYGCNTICLNK